MPWEGDRHERTWMAWPSGHYTLGESREDAEVAFGAWAAVANAVAQFEPVSMLVDPRTLDAAKNHLTSAITLHETTLDDAWYRDSGPTFVLSADRTSLGAVNWEFNGWGQQEWASWENDAFVSEIATDESGAQPIVSRLVNEGGGIHTDGKGTFLVTRTVQLDPGRNPDWTPEQVEAELARTVGAKKVIWLDRGLARDAEELGTRGHVDLVAAFSAPGTVLVHQQLAESHPDHAIAAALRAQLAAATDAADRSLEIIDLPAPMGLQDGQGFVDHSYVNHYVVNGGVIVGTFGDPHDDAAMEILAAAYPGREVVGVPGAPIFSRGGGVHCITQQQPAVEEAAG